MKNLLIVKPSALGDVVQATSVLPLLKGHFPGLRITWLVFEHNADIVRNHPLIDHVICVKRKNSVLRQLPNLARELRLPHFDAVMDIQCLLRSALLSRLTGCPRRIGFADGREQSTRFYTETYDVPATDMHAVDRYLRLCELLGVPKPKEVIFPLPLTDTHRNVIDGLVSDFAGHNPLITICPTARWKTKCWPEASFAALADALYAHRNARTVLVGAANETGIVARVARQMSHGCLDLSGKLSIMQLAALLERSDLYIGNDSGPMHLAAAVGVRAVAIFGPTSPLRTGPYGKNHMVFTAGLDCSPCFRKTCDTLRCMNAVSVEEVFQKVMDQFTIP